MNGALGLVPARYERSLVLEALTLLAQSQTDLEHAVGDQVAHAAQRVASIERRCDEFDARLLSIDEHLQQLVLQLAPPPDPDIDERLARLQAHVQRLSSREHRPSVIESWSPPPAAPNGPAPAPERPAPPTLRASQQLSEPPPRTSQRQSEPPPPTLEQPAAQAPRTGEPSAPAPLVRAGRTTAVAVSQPSMWELLGPTPKDRVAIILMGIGLVALVFAVLLQLRLP